MNNQSDLFAQKITKRLDDSLADIAPHIQKRLNVARGIAVDKIQPPKANRVGRNELALNFAHFRSKMSGLAALILLAMAMAMAMVIMIQYSQIQANADEAADLDAEILADDAPVQAYTDPAFSLVFRSGLLSSEK